MAHFLHRFAVIALAAGLAACSSTNDPAVIVETGGGVQVPVRVEVADEPAERSLGLMHRTELARDAGMLFLFERESKQSFWMKNTPLPLDLIFISAEGRIVGIRENTVPFSLDAIAVDAPSSAVLEVNAGFAKAHGLAPGNRVTYRGVDGAK